MGSPIRWGGVWVVGGDPCYFTHSQNQRLGHSTASTAPRILLTFSPLDRMQGAHIHARGAHPERVVTGHLGDLEVELCAEPCHRGLDGGKRVGRGQKDPLEPRAEILLKEGQRGVPDENRRVLDAGGVEQAQELRAALLGPREDVLALVDVGGDEGVVAEVGLHLLQLQLAHRELGPGANPEVLQRLTTRVIFSPLVRQ